MLQVWADAASQVLYSFGIGGGTMVVMGSYNDKHHDFIKYVDSNFAFNLGLKQFALENNF